MIKIFKWPIIYLFSTISLITITSFVFNINFILQNKVYIGLLISLIFIPLLINDYNKLNIKHSKFNLLYLILLGIFISFIYNYIIYKLNSYYNFTNLYNENNNIVGTIICSGILGPIIEELMFRGIIYNNLNQKYNKITSIIITTITFSLFHLNIIQIIYCLIFGIILIYIYEKNHNILSVIILHIISNITSILFVLMM